MFAMHFLCFKSPFLLYCQQNPDRSDELTVLSNSVPNTRMKKPFRETSNKILFIFFTLRGRIKVWKVIMYMKYYLDWVEQCKRNLHPSVFWAEHDSDSQTPSQSEQRREHSQTPGNHVQNVLPFCLGCICSTSSAQYFVQHHNQDD